MSDVKSPRYSAKKLKGLIKPKDSEREEKPLRPQPQSRKAMRQKVRASVRRSERRFADNLASANESGLNLDATSLFATADDAQSYVQLLKEVAEHSTREHKRTGRTALREAMQDVYSAVVALKTLPQKEREAVITSLHKSVSQDGNSRVNKANSTRLVLQAMLGYAKIATNRSKLTRDAQALEYALSKRIPPSEFVLQLAKKGQSMRRWADLYAAANRVDRPASNRRVSTGTAPPQSISIELDPGTLTREGTYLLAVNWDGEEAIHRETTYLGIEDLDEDLLDAALRSAATAVPVNNLSR